MTGVTLAALLEERDREVVGAKILELVGSLAASVVRSYDPGIYASGGSWQDGLADLVQDVVVDRLLSEGQLDYSLDTADSLEALNALLIRQIRRTLARRRRRTVVDNLLDRIREILDSDYVAEGISGERLFAPEGAIGAERATDAQLRAAVVAVSAVPRTPTHGEARAPMVYTTDALRDVVATAFTTTGSAMAIRDFDTILNLALTSWIASDLATTRGGVSNPAAADLTPPEIVEVEAIVDDIRADLDGETAPVLDGKYRGMSDSDIAHELGLSRPTIAKRKLAAMAILRRHLEDSSEEMQDAVVASLGERLRQEPR